MRNKIINSIVFVIGYALSPFTWWNDVFINLPIAYFFASIILAILKKYFLESFIFFYWLSNVLGVYLMFISGKAYIQERIKPRKGLLIIINIAFYTILIGLLAYLGILKPLKLASIE